MLKPSDFNNAVPQFQNGNYASNPINPKYVEEPSSTDYNRGSEPLQTLPAQWWNWFMNKFTSRFNKVNIYVKNLFNELAQLLSLVNVTPDGTEGAVTDGQLKNAFKELYPDYINTKLALKSTYVKKTQKVNNHALSGDITISKADVGLGSVANTGDSANASSGGTTKFTTGGAYNLLTSIAPYFSSSIAYTVGQLVTYQNKLYECTASHLGAWNASHFTERTISAELALSLGFTTLTDANNRGYSGEVRRYYVDANTENVPDGLPSAFRGILEIFQQSNGAVTWQRLIVFYYGTGYTSAVSTFSRTSYWNGAEQKWGNWREEADKADITTLSDTKADLSDLAPAFSASTNYAVGDYVIYSRDLYRCTVAHSAGAWNASHFTVVTVGGELETKANQTDLAVPSDAVLHYSFDEVPDYPDGTADVRLIDNNTYDIQNTSQYFRVNGGSGATISNVNGNIKVTVTTAGTYRGINIPNEYIKNKVIKLKINILSCSGEVVIDNGIGIHVLSTDKTGTYEVSFIGNNYTTSNNSLFVMSNYVYELIIEAIYIGDGSYSTPIIDNANGQFNATNNGGIATNGVSGKGAYFLNRKYAQVSNFNLTDNFTISFWIKPDTDADITLGNILIKDEQIILRNGVSWGNRLYLYLYQNGEGSLKDLGGLLPKNVWTHFVLSKEGTTLNAYRNGVVTHSFTLSNTSIDKNTNPLRLSDPNNTYSQSIDDLLIFDRALTETEVMALYLNKANTPKYYGEVPVTRKVNGYTLEEDITLTKADVGLGDVANKDLSNVVNTGDSATPVSGGTTKFTTGGAYTELAKKVDKTTTVNGHALSGNVTVTKGDVSLGNVVNTGDSAIPVSDGTTKFTTGGAYNLLTSLAPIFSTSISYAVGDMVTYSGKLYTCTTAHSAGAWDSSHFTVANLNTEFQKPANNIAEDFQVNKAYEKGHLVIYNKELYKCIQTTNVQLTEWDATKFQKVSMYTKRSGRATSLTRYVLNVSLGGQTHSASLPALCAGSELFIRLNNDNNRSGMIELQAYHAYTLGVTYSDGGMSTLQKLTSGQELSITVAPNSYLEVSVNYINVDEEGLANLTMLTYPIPSVDYS